MFIYSYCLPGCTVLWMDDTRPRISFLVRLLHPNQCGIFQSLNVFYWPQSKGRVDDLPPHSLELVRLCLLSVVGCRRFEYLSESIASQILLYPDHIPRLLLPHFRPSLPHFRPSLPHFRPSLPHFRPLFHKPVPRSPYLIARPTTPIAGSEE